MYMYCMYMKGQIAAAFGRSKSKSCICARLAAGVGQEEEKLDHGALIGRFSEASVCSCS